MNPTTFIDLVDNKMEVDCDTTIKVYSFDLPRNKVYGQENFTRIQYPLNYLKTKLNSNIFHISNTYDEEKVIQYISNYYSPKYLELIKKLKFPNKDVPYDCIGGDWDTHFDAFTYQELMISFELILQSFEDVKTYNLKMAYLLIRPPSHHSHANHHEGFCVINNTFILADLCSKYYGKTLIFDYDLHHCNGTEKMLTYSNNNLIQLISTHYYNKQKFYPGTGKSSKTNNITNINLRKGITTENCLVKLDSTLEEIKTSEYKCVVISNGLDSHGDDLYAMFNLTDEFYVTIAQFFKSLNIPVFYVLEGGYNNHVIARVSEKIINVFN